MCSKPAPMRISACAIWIVIPLLATFAGGSPATAAATPSNATACLVRVFDVTPISSEDGVRASVWAVSLRTNNVVEGMKTTGVFSLVSKSERYDIPFKDFPVPKPRDEMKEIPLLVTFPKLVRLVSGYVETVTTSARSATKRSTHTIAIRCLPAREKRQCSTRRSPSRIRNFPVASTTVSKWDLRSASSMWNRSRTSEKVRPSNSRWIFRMRPSHGMRRCRSRPETQL